MSPVIWWRWQVSQRYFMSATFLRVALGFFQRGNLCGPQRHHVSVQKIPLGLSFPKTQKDRKVGVALGAAVDRCDVPSHPSPSWPALQHRIFVQRWSWGVAVSVNKFPRSMIHASSAIFSQNFCDSTKNNPAPCHEEHVSVPCPPLYIWSSALSIFQMRKLGTWEFKWPAGNAYLSNKQGNKIWIQADWFHNPTFSLVSLSKRPEHLCFRAKQVETVGLVRDVESVRWVGKEEVAIRRRRY